MGVDPRARTGTARALIGRALVVVPTYDEAGTIAAAVIRALDADDRVDVLVVDDGSPDGTGTIVAQMARADRRLHVLHRERKAGLGSAYRAGFAFAEAAGYDAVVEMDADLSHPADRLVGLLDALEDGADLAIGSRYVPGGRVVGWPAHRYALSRGGNLYVRAVTGLPVRDATAGFRAYTAAAADSARRCVSEGYAFQVEATVRCWRAGGRIVEIPITFRERETGESKMSGRVVREAVAMVWACRRRGLRRGDGRFQRPRPRPAALADARRPDAATSLVASRR